MNARTTLSATGEVALPADVRERLAWTPGTALEVVETPGGVMIRPAAGKATEETWVVTDVPAVPADPATGFGGRPSLGRLFPRKTLTDLHAIAGYDGPPKSIEEISRLSDDAIRRILDEGD